MKAHPLLCDSGQGPLPLVIFKCVLECGSGRLGQW